MNLRVVMVTIKDRSQGAIAGVVQSALKKHMCFFVLFFTLVAFFSCNFLERAFLCFFLAKMCFFSVEPPIFSQKYHYFEGFGHKEIKKIFKICYFILISLKKFSALLHSA